LQSQLVSLIDTLGGAPAVDTGAAPAAETKDTGAAPAVEPTPAEKKDAADKAVKEMISLIDRCRTLHPEIKYDGLSALELMKAAIAHVDPTVKMDGADWQDPKFVAGVFAMTKPRAKTHGIARAAAAEGAQREDGEDPLDKAKRMDRESRQNAWRGAPAKS
jgi:hypothetical protein